MKAPAEALLQVERSISREKGPFSLFALFLREEAPGKWDLVVSAPWIEKDKRSALKLLSERVQRSLAASDLLSISRIGLADPSDPAVGAINRAWRVEHSSVEVRDSTFFGLQIKHALIFASNRQGEEVRQRTARYAARGKRGRRSTRSG